MSDVTCNRWDYDRAFAGLNQRYATPEATPTTYLCRRVRIPDLPQFRMAVTELISRLAFCNTWDETPGGLTADECAALGSALVESFDESGDFCMIGAIVAFAGNDLPGNMLECDGSTHNRVDYPALYVILDENFIIDPDTFRTPDLRGRMVLGVSDDYSIDSQGGTAYQALAVENLPAHTHVQNSHNHEQNSHNHEQQAHSHNSAPHGHALTDPQHNHGMNHAHPLQARSNSAAGSNAELMRSNGTGTDADFNSGTSTLNPTGSASTGISIGSGIATIDNTIAANMPATAVNQATTATNQNTGGNIPHNNMPPYRALRMVIVAR